MSQQPLADFVGICVFIAALLFSADVANLVGPYMAILIASTVGASFALGRRDRSTRGGAIFFFVRLNFMALLFTVAIAALINSIRPDLPSRFLVAPIALLIGFAGDDWPSILRRLSAMFWRVLDLARGKADPQ